MPAPIRIAQPEGGAERGVTFARRHKCEQGKALISSQPDCDTIVFPVGLYGFDIPRDIPFIVHAHSPCKACGATLTAWFVWGAAAFEHKGIWTP